MRGAMSHAASSLQLTCKAPSLCRAGIGFRAGIQSRMTRLDGDRNHATLRRFRNRGSVTALGGSEDQNGVDEGDIMRLSWSEDFEELRPRAYLIFNPVAGQGNLQTCLGIISSTLLPSMDLVILQTTPTISAAALARRALKENADVIIASGGDGTISEVAGELIGSGKPMGIIPRGTANAFSVALGIPTHLDSLNYVRDACHVILAGNQRVVDAAWASGDWGRWPLTLLLGIGLEAEMVEAADRDMKNLLGPLAYIVAGVKAINRNQPFFSIRGTFDGVESSTSRAHAVTIANVAPPASLLSQGLGQVIPDDGLLETMAFVDDDVGAAKLSIFNLAIKQMILQSPEGADVADETNVIGLRAKSVTLDCDPPQKVVVDGEVLGHTPVSVEVVPGGLVVLAPPPCDQTSRERASLALVAELDRLRKVMAESAENSDLSPEQLLNDNRIMMARVNQIEKDLVQLYGMPQDLLHDLDNLL